MRFRAGYIHVVKLHVDGWDKFRLCFGISWAFCFQVIFECAVCLCDFYIKTDSRIIWTKQRKELETGWKVPSCLVRKCVWEGLAPDTWGRRRHLRLTQTLLPGAHLAFTPSPGGRRFGELAAILCPRALCTGLLIFVLIPGTISSIVTGIFCMLTNQIVAVWLCPCWVDEFEILCLSF